MSPSPLANSSDIDNALAALLGADPALLALCPNGVYMDEAPPGATRFVIVSLVPPTTDEGVFGGRAYEDNLYLVEARILNTPPGGNVNAAAQRIDQLLEDQPLTVPGYRWMTMYRENRTRIVEPDRIDVGLRWMRRGGHYRVQMAVVQTQGTQGNESLGHKARVAA